MRDYRAYVLDDDGKIVRGRDFKAADDADAFRVARELFPEDVCEVWCGERVVGRTDREDQRPQIRSCGC